MVEGAVLDCYDEEERPTGFATMVEGDRQTIHLLDLPLPEPPPEGAKWIAAYRHWAR